MNRLLMAVSVLMLLLAFLSIHSMSETPAEAPEAEESVTSKDTAVRGQGLYMKYCALCHGEEGEGYLADEANALANQDFLKTATDGFLFEAIARGRPGTPMSAWGQEMGGVLPDDDVYAIVEFLRGWQTESAIDLSIVRVKGDAEKGAEIYKTWCAACHGQRGEGASALSLNNPVFQETVGDGFLRYAIENGRRGTSMSAFKTRLSSEDIADVITFIRTMESSAKPAAVDPDLDVTFTPDRLRRALMNPGMPLAEFSPWGDRFVPADTVYKAYKEKRSFIIVDARPHNEYLKAHIEGAVSIPFYEVEQAVDYLPRDAWIITYCVCPHAMSGKALDQLREAGFKKTAILDEGFYVWRSRGYPVVGE